MENKFIKNKECKEKQWYIDILEKTKKVNKI